jgi:hypothetical protein
MTNQEMQDLEHHLTSKGMKKKEVDTLFGGALIYPEMTREECVGKLTTICQKLPKGA